jgi:hypothetical protein
MEQVLQDRVETAKETLIRYDHPILLLQHMVWHEGYHPVLGGLVPWSSLGTGLCRGLPVPNRASIRMDRGWGMRLADGCGTGLRLPRL